MATSDNPFADRPTCETCGSAIPDSLAGLDECYGCRTTDRRDPPQTSCPVCDEDPIKEAQLRALNGNTLDDVRVCVINSGGEVYVHRVEGDDGDG